MGDTLPTPDVPTCGACSQNNGRLTQSNGQGDSALIPQTLMASITAALSRRGQRIPREVRITCESAAAALQKLGLGLNLNLVDSEAPSPQPAPVRPPITCTEVLTAYILAVWACGGKWCPPDLKEASRVAPPRRAAQALKCLNVELRVNIVSDPALPDLRRLLEIEYRRRGETRWTCYGRLQLITNIAYGEVWQYGKLIQAGARARKRGSAVQYSIHWGSRAQDYNWALQFMADLTPHGQPLEILHKKEAEH